MTNPHVASNLTYFPPPTASFHAHATARMINRQQGEALERLAHAIEYLEDGLAPTAAHSFAGRELLDSCEAIETLRAHHRSFWYSLPLRVPLWRRFMAWHHGPAQVITLPSA